MSVEPAILCVDKPPGATSHDAVQWVRWALREKSVGHFGTLDPGATGLLVLGVGAATRLGPFLTGLDKTYAATVTFGTATSTDDAEGEIVAAADCTHLTGEAIEAAAAGLTGALSLPPPAVSAIHVDGKRAHARVRAGEDVTLDPRPMHVHAVTEVVAQPGPAVELVVRVSKGTYVRSLAVELGRRLGVPAHLSALRRRAVGTLTVDDPGTIAGLQVTGTPPRARIGLAGLADDAERRAQTAAHLTPALHPAWHGAPFPIVQTSPTDDGAALWRALGHGQRCTLRPGQLRGASPTAGLVGVRAAGPALVVCELDDVGALCPRRRIGGTDA